MPTPMKGEDKNEFIGRCIPILKDEGKEQDQAVAICYSMWEERNESIVKKIDFFLQEDDGGTTTGDVAKNVAKGHIDVISRGVASVGYKCPKGQRWDKNRRKCVPISESSIVGGSYADGTTINIVGSGQTRVAGDYDYGKIDALKIKSTKVGGKTRFSNILGAYLPEEEDETPEEENM